jgi:archaellum component FlaF (FlaF/FlaG flagellin family)
MKKLFFLAVLLVILISCKKSDCDGNGTILCINSSLYTEMNVLIDGKQMTYLTPQQSRSISVSKGSHKYSFVSDIGWPQTVFCSATVEVTACKEITLTCNY